MASEQQVRDYLALWFQLGKRVLRDRGAGAIAVPHTHCGNRCSTDFERAWATICQDASSYHLEGTDQSIADLLDPRWEVQTCARCTMPVAVDVQGLPAGPCPCSDLGDRWPDDSLPPPRLPASDREHLSCLYQRLLKKAEDDDEDEPETAATAEGALSSGSYCAWKPDGRSDVA